MVNYTLVLCGYVIIIIFFYFFFRSTQGGEITVYGLTETA